MPSALGVCSTQFCWGKDRLDVDSEMQRLSSVVVMGAGF